MTHIDSAVWLSGGERADAKEVAGHPGKWAAHIGVRLTIFGTPDQLRAVAEGVLADLPASVDGTTGPDGPARAVAAIAHPFHDWDDLSIEQQNTSRDMATAAIEAHTAGPMPQPAYHDDEVF